MITRQDLGAIAGAAPCLHVVLALADNVDALPFLAELWRSPLGRTPLSDHYDLAPLAVGVDPGRLLNDLRCVHRAADIFGDHPQAVPLTLAEAAARQVEAAHVMVLRDGGVEDDGRLDGSRALLAHLNPSALVLLDGEERDSTLLTPLTRPGSGWAAAGPADRLDVINPRAVWETDRTLKGHTVRLTGLVTPGHHGAWYVSRLVIRCCAADAQVRKVGVHGPAAPPADTWVTGRSLKGRRRT